MRRMIPAAVVLAGALCGYASPGFGQGTVTAMSLADPSLISETGGAASSTPSVSTDGRYVAFVSAASNLVAGQVDDNFDNDVFLYDRVSGTTTLVSHTSASLTTTGNAFSSAPVISGDGAYVAFTSLASNMGFSDTNSQSDIILFARATGALSLVSHTGASLITTGNDQSSNPVISGDGAYVAFTSLASNMGFSDTNGRTDIILFARATGAFSLVSHTGASLITTGNHRSSNPVMSADGAYVVFTSEATDLGFTDGNSAFDVILLRRATGALSLVSRTGASPTTTGNNESSDPVISSDGAYVAFASRASDLGFPDSNGYSDVILFTRASGFRDPVSGAGNGPSYSPVISSDGLYVAFTSDATDLGFTDTNGVGDVILYTRAFFGGTHSLVSHSGASPTTTGNGRSERPVISSNGAHVAFHSRATDLGFADTNNQSDVILFARDSSPAGALSLVSHTHGSLAATGNGPSQPPVINGDGTYVAFTSLASDLSASIDSNSATDVFLFERSTGSNDLVSARDAASLTGGGASFSSSISADGRYVAFVSAANNLVAGQVDNNFGTDVFLYDRVLETSVLVSHSGGGLTTTGNQPAFSPAISADGAYVAFTSDATDLGFVDGNPYADVILFERATGTLFLVSHNSASLTTTGNGLPESPVINGDGAFVAFVTSATNLGFTDGNGGKDVILFARATGALTLVSHNSAFSHTTTGNGRSFSPVISRDGAFVAFATSATDMGFNDFNSTGSDVILFARGSGAHTLVSHTSTSPFDTGNGGSDNPVISDDGAYVAFTSSASNLGFTDSDGTGDVILFTRATGALSLVSHSGASLSTTGNGVSESPRISGDGAYVAFQSSATDLGFTDGNSLIDVFLFSRSTAALSLVSHTGASLLETGNRVSWKPVISGDGAYVAFTSFATNLGFTDANSEFVSDVILWGRATGVLSLVSHSGASSTTTGNGLSEAPVIGGSGAQVAFNSYSSDLVAGDHNGLQDAFLYSDGEGRFSTLSPCRLVDTRLSPPAPPPLGGPALATGEIRTFTVTGLCGVPLNARALSINATVTQAGGAGEVTLYRSDLVAVPGTTNVSFKASADRANNGIVELGRDGLGAFSARALFAGGGTVHLIVDVNGYFE